MLRSGVTLLRRTAARAASSRPESSQLVLSSRMSQKVTRNILEGIDLMVCDMAGTTVQEGGLVYRTLHQSMVDGGLEVSSAEMEPWHGAKKEAVIEHFARQAGIPESQLEEKINGISDAFIAAIDTAYFDDAATISHIDIGLFGYFKELRSSGIKIALDTGYPPNIQQGLVERLGFDAVVDGYISSYDVAEGRPYPYMIHRLMERLRIENVKRVCKVGDSVRDIEEGRNAGCGLVVGVLSGADDAESLLAAGADVIAGCVTDLPVPRARAREAKLRLPDLS
mmetsp:Transcript_268/g.526  ORF Transcript_268/g.526 Transcript_268/m.526 type:complete len:281 (+) Transcript_268:47-889(+)